MHPTPISTVTAWKQALKNREHGYDATDFQGFVKSNSPLYAMDEQGFRSSLAELKSLADAQGIAINQAH